MEDIIRSCLLLLNNHPMIVISDIHQQYALQINQSVIEYRQIRRPGVGSSAPYTSFRFDIASQILYINSKPTACNFNEKFLPIFKTILKDLQSKKAIVLNSGGTPC